MKVIVVVIALLLVSLTAPGPASLCHGDSSQTSVTALAPFDAELYGLAYDVFMGNNNPGDAFLVAEKAVASLPLDTTWRRRAAQSAESSGNGSQALEHWFFLATEGGQPDAADNALRLARGAGDNRRIKKLLEVRGFEGDTGLLREYITVCEAVGTPADAIRVLEQRRSGPDRTFALEQLARLYDAAGRPAEAAAARRDLAAPAGQPQKADDILPVVTAHAPSESERPGPGNDVPPGSKKPVDVLLQAERAVVVLPHEAPEVVELPAEADAERFDAAASYGSTADDLPKADVSRPAVGKRSTFDNELYGLGYDVFLANNNPGEAFLVAEKAVAALPHDTAWRRRAAQSGEWSSNGARALEHWLFLATEGGQPEAADNALRLARGLGDNRRIKQLLEARKSDGDSGLLREYVEVCEAMGAPGDAIRVLELRRSGPDRKFALEQLARIYEATGRPAEAVTARLDLAAAYGVTADNLLKAATLAYGSRNLMGAYTIMALGKGLIPSKEREFWQTFSDLAWSLQDAQTVKLAARMLMESGNSREIDYQRLIILNRESQPTIAYNLALEEWRRFGSGNAFITLLELGIATGRQAEVEAIHRAAQQSGSLKLLESDTYYWTLLAQLYRGTGSIKASLRAYREGLRRAPADGGLAAGYIWLLLDLDQRRELRETLQAWKGREKTVPDLYDPLAAAYAYLGEYQRALPLFQTRYLQMRRDPGWLAAYADTLEQSGWAEAAFMERLRALHLARKRMKAGAGKTEADRRALVRDFARLAMQIEPGDALDTLMRKMLRDRQDESSRELVAAWALYTGRSDLARLWFWREYARMARRPRWVELALALEENDRPRIARLLKYDLERLPYRDAIEGALRTGQRELAEQLAFEWGGKNPNDYLLYEQMREIYGAHPAFARTRLSLADRGGVGFGQHVLTVSQPLTRRWTLLAEQQTTLFSALRSNAIGALPAQDMSGRVGFNYRLEKGEVSFSAGGRTALENFGFASAAVDYRLTPHWRMTAGVHYADRASESVPISIGGIKDMLSVTTEHGLTPRDTVSGRATLFSLRDQQRRLLGVGKTIDAEYNRLFTFAYPDVRMRLHGGYNHYSRDGQPEGKLLTLAPNGVTPDISYFVPASFWQIGSGLSFGSATRTSYTKEWRLFGSFDLGWNSRTNLGWNYETGVHGPLIGLDKFFFSISQDSGSFGLSDLNTILELGYSYYFN